MTHAQDEAPSEFLVSCGRLLPPSGAALDLAAGRGRNALWLAEQGLRVTAVDRDAGALDALSREAAARGLAVSVEARDLEAHDATLPDGAFDVIVVCRFLHRPLFPAIRRALRPGGLLVYETFTVERARIRKPTNPDFLLRRNELLHRFLDWRVHCYVEAVPGGHETVAAIAARKPAAPGASAGETAPSG
jgi:tellurite methyltransferase